MRRRLVEPPSIGPTRPPRRGSSMDDAAPPHGLGDLIARALESKARVTVALSRLLKEVQGQLKREHELVAH